MDVDRQDPELDTQPPRQFTGVFQAAPGRIARRHAYSQHVFSTQRGHGERGGHRRVDAAGQPHYRLAEPGFPQVVRQAQDQSAVNRCRAFLRFCLEDRERIYVVEAKHPEIRLETQPLQHHPPPAVGQETGPVKHQIVVTPDLIHVQDRPAVPGGDRADHFQALPLFSQVIGGGGEIYEQVHAPVRQFLHGVDRVGRDARYAADIPDILAHGHPQTEVPQGQRRLRGARGKVPPLVKHVVFGQQGFRYPACHAPVTEQHSRIEQAAVIPAHRRAHQDGDLGGGGADAVQTCFHRVQEIGPAEQVLRWVPANGQFGENHQVGRRLPGTPRSGHNQVRVAVDIPHRGVDLGHRDTHRRHPRYTDSANQKTTPTGCKPPASCAPAAARAGNGPPTVPG